MLADFRNTRSSMTAAHIPRFSSSRRCSSEAFDQLSQYDASTMSFRHLHHFCSKDGIGQVRTRQLITSSAALPNLSGNDSRFSTDDVAAASPSTSLLLVNLITSSTGSYSSSPQHIIHRRFKIQTKPRPPPSPCCDSSHQALLRLEHLLHLHFSIASPLPCAPPDLMSTVIQSSEHESLIRSTQASTHHARSHPQRSVHITSRTHSVVSRQLYSHY